MFPLWLAYKSRNVSSVIHETVCLCVAQYTGSELPVAQGDKLLSLEAMKMVTTLYAERDGEVAEVLVYPGSQVAPGDLMIRLE